MRNQIRSRRPPIHFLLLFTLVLVLSLSMTTSVGAGQNEEAGIVGQVTDDSGAAMPGVSVTASSPALQTHQMSAVTNERGEYRLSPLPIGTYDVTYVLTGFQSVKREGIRLTVGFVARLDLPMKVGALEETVTVSGASPLVDTTSTATRTELTKERLELVPSSRSGLVSLMAMAPGVRPNLDVGGNIFNATINFHAFGQDGESWQAVEGVVTTSPNSGNQGGNYWDSNAFEEARVQTVGNGADVPVRGIGINAVIRSGGNDFSGSGYFAGTNYHFASDPGLAGNPINSRYDVNGDLGGRLVRNKLWFYSAARYRAETDGTLQCVQDDGSQCVARNSLGYSTTKLTYQVNPSNRLIGFEQFTHKYTMSGGSRLSSYDSRSAYTIPIFTNKVEWQMVKGSSLVTSLQFGYFGWTRQGTTGYSDMVATSDQITGLITGINSGASFGPQPEYRIQPKGALTWYRPNWFGGNHAIKVNGGYQWIRTDVGYHTLPPDNYSRILRSGVPFEITVYNYPVLPIDMARYLDIAAEDSWTIKRRLTLNLGVRYAHNPGFAPAQCSAAADGPGAAISPGACFSRIDYNTWNPVVPRLHAAYDVTGDGKTVINGGWGRFAHMRQTDEVAVANHNYPTSSIYRWHDSATTGSVGQYDPGEVNLDPNGKDFVSTSISGTTGALANGVVNPNEREPMTDEFSLQFQRELLPDFGARVTGVYSRNSHTYELANLLRPPSSYTVPVTNPIPLPDGTGTTGQTITYYEYPGSLAGAAFQQPTLVNNAAADATYASVELAVTKRLAHRWQFDASYSLTQVHVPIVPNTGTPTSLYIYIATDDPNNLINNANDTKEWLARASGVYLAPWGLGVSMTFESRSGDPWARTVSVAGGTTIPSITLKVEPLGTQRLPEVNLTNLRIEKTLSLPGRQKVTLRGNLYNALNSQVPTGVTTLSGINYGIPTALVPPRIFELSGVYRF